MIKKQVKNYHNMKKSPYKMKGFSGFHNSPLPYGGDNAQTINAFTTSVPSPNKFITDNASINDWSNTMGGNIEGAQNNEAMTTVEPTKVTTTIPANTEITATDKSIDQTIK
tara:strand:+ start:316 stop:648 length:333 start_codon:yes stop_codon:yes gene_type:complete